MDNKDKSSRSSPSNSKPNLAKIQPQKPYIPHSSFSVLKSAAFQSTKFHRNRVMSESLPINYGRDRTLSLFDMLLNNSRHDNDNSNYTQQQAQAREAYEHQTISSSLIENLLTEYLISLPSSLDEFYKIMGEIYVSEILKQCPHIHSPIELMKETLLGRYNSSDESQGNKNLLNSMVRHILQSNLQTQNNSGIEQHLMQSMMNGEGQRGPSLDGYQLNQERATASNSFLNNIMHQNSTFESPQKASPTKISSPKVPEEPMMKKRDLKALKLKEKERAALSNLKASVFAPQQNSSYSTGITKKTENKNNGNKAQTSKIMDNESLIEKAKSLLNKRGKKENPRKNQEVYKRQKIGENSEVASTQDKQRIDVPDELKLGYPSVI